MTATASQPTHSADIDAMREWMPMALRAVSDAAVLVYIGRRYPGGVDQFRRDRASS